jgi:HNH endonuclease
MKTYREILKPGDVAFAVKTDGDGFLYEKDGESSSGVWKVNSKKHFNKVIVYHQLDGKADIYIGDFVRSDPVENKVTLVFNHSKKIGSTFNNWTTFTGGKSRGYSRIYLSLSSNEINFSELQKTLDGLNVDIDTINNVLREVWCRSIEHKKFREKLRKLWDNQCAVTGLQNKGLLIASHIKPWSACQDTPRDQTNVHNGLLLCAPVDKLFDRGFLTFNNDGSIELHKIGHTRFLKKAALSTFGVDAAKLPKIKQPLSKQTKVFLEYHRENVFHRN